MPASEINPILSQSNLLQIEHLLVEGCGFFNVVRLYGDVLDPGHILVLRKCSDRALDLCREPTGAQLTGDESFHRLDGAVRLRTRRLYPHVLASGKDFQLAFAAG